MKRSGDELRMVFGIIILLILAALAAAIALGKVEEKTSFGLQQILGALAVLAGQFSQWAFGRPPDPPERP